MLDNNLHQRRILLGITGGIAAYKVLELIRRLRERGALVKTVVTKAGLDFVTPISLQALTGEDTVHDAMSHITLARWAEVILIAPASANFIAKFSHGLADDLLSTICLATTAPIMLAPAMNQQMWQNVATQQNIKILVERNVPLLGPASGDQACGENGPGRMLEPDELLQALDKHFAPKLLSNKHIVITAGPTIEAIDPVRFLSNHSSGKMGYALTAAAIKMGATVTLISGPTSLAPPHGVNFVGVQSAQQMLDAVLATIHKGRPKVDIFIGVAAVADYKPLKVATNKLKKTSARITLELERTPDILQAVAELTPELRPFTIGFAAETQNLLQHAQQKLQAKCLDLLIANSVENGKVFNAVENKAWILHKDARVTELPLMSKAQLAHKILEEII